MRYLCLIFIISSALCITKEDVYENSWAVIIGIDNYKYSDPLKYAVNDANSIRDLLIRKFNFSRKNITFIKNEEATIQAIKTALYDVVTKSGSNDRILIFYSGHGETISTIDGSELGYIIPYEGKQTDPYVTGLSMDEILRTSRIGESKHMLFLMDACYSGLMTETTKGISKTSDRGYLSTISKEKSRQIITAGSGAQKVIERDEWQHSAFTKNLLSGLGEWGADTDGNGYITTDELGTYLISSVTDDTDNFQTPSKGRFKKSGIGEFIFFKSIKSSFKEVYYDNGQIWKQGTLNNGYPDGNWTYYYKNGYKLLEGQFDKGIATGNWMWYYDNGDKAIEANLIDGSIDAIELKLYDFIVQEKDVQKSEDLIIIELDEETLQVINEPLPVSRTIWAKAIKNLSDANVKVIVFYYIFDSSDQKMEILRKYMKNYNLEGEIEDADEEFIRAIEYAESKGTKVVLGSKVGWTKDLGVHYIGAYEKFITDNRINILLGVVNSPYNHDNFVRRYSVYYHHSDLEKKYNTLATQAVLKYLEINNLDPKINRENRTIHFGSLNENNLEIPYYRQLNNKGPSFFVNLSTEFHKVPLYKIIDTNNEVDNIFSNKIVVIGTTLPIHQDFTSSSYQSFRNDYDPNDSYSMSTNGMSGVEYQGHAIQTMIDNSYNHFFPIDTTNYNVEFREIKINGSWNIY